MLVLVLATGALGCGSEGAGDGIWSLEQKEAAIELSGPCEKSQTKYQDYAPPAGCECADNWAYYNEEVCGGCAKPDLDAHGPWCKTKGQCGDLSWAYCEKIAS
jgi:hypothetical protein